MDIIIVDDDHLVVNSLRTIVEASGINVLGVGHSGKDAIQLFEKFHPDVVLMDIRMNDISGIEATGEILQIDGNGKILLITTFQDDAYIREALSLGCRGYILKQNIDSIIPSIHAVHAGNMVFDSKIVSSMKKYKEKNMAGELSELSHRELDILNLLAEGLNNKEIANTLYLSEGTVRNYISTMLDKLGLRDRTQLAIYYYKSKFDVEEDG